VHLNRLIRLHDLNMIYMTGPGHGAPGIVANTYLEGIYSEIYPDISQDAEGMQKLFKQFSFPGGIASHTSPETPGSIHEGGELGYAISHAYGAAFDNPDLIVACIVGDGEAETGPLATAWHSNKFLNPIHDGAVFEATDRSWMADTLPEDEHLAPDGRVMEILSEHTCQGWLEGYLLTGRHGFFSCYEAFIHIVDSMFNQHAKWLKTTRHEVLWRRPIASLNYLLTSHVWQQDHNGFSHQDPGFIDHVVNKKADVIRVYLPPDANTLLSVVDHYLRSRHYVNVIVAGKHPALQYLDMDAALKHCTAGIGIWEWASNDRGREPDVVMACAGDVPTLETLAAVHFLRQHVPDLKIRVINVVDLMKLQPATSAAVRYTSRLALSD
jgi:phosphoketolase